MVRWNFFLVDPPCIFESSIPPLELKSSESRISHLQMATEAKTGSSCHIQAHIILHFHSHILIPSFRLHHQSGTWLSIFWARSPKYTSSAALITIGSAAAKIKNNNLQHLKIQAAAARACRSRNVDLVNQQRLHHPWIIQSSYVPTLALIRKEEITDFC